jgi:hypothetical protein
MPSPISGNRNSSSWLSPSCNKSDRTALKSSSDSSLRGTFHSLTAKTNSSPADRKKIEIVLKKITFAIYSKDKYNFVFQFRGAFKIKS